MNFRWTPARKRFAMWTFITAPVVIGVALFVTLIFDNQQPKLADIPQTPEGELLGVDPDHFAYAQQAYAAYPQAFMAEAGDQENERKNARIWLMTREVSMPGKPAGKDPWTGPQGTGDCVAVNGSTAMTHCIGRQIYLGESSSGGIVFPCYYYGIARRSGDQHGYGQIPCRSAGAIPSLFALNTPKHGPVFFHDVESDGIKYSGKKSDEWGCNGVPEKWLTLGLSRPGSEAYPIRSINELRDAICNGYPCSYAGPFTPGRKYKQDFRNCMTWDGGHLGYHQMCVLGYDGSLGQGREYFFIQNSHGADNPPQHIVTAATKPLTDEPEGGFWVSRKTMQSMLDRQGEIWAFSAVKGFEKNEIDWSAWDQFRAEPIPQRAEPIQENENEDAIDDRRAAVRLTTLAI